MERSNDIDMEHILKTTLDLFFFFGGGGAEGGG